MFLRIARAAVSISRQRRSVAGMNPANTDPDKRITDLVPRQSQAITEMLVIEAAVRRLHGSEQELTDAQEKVVAIAKLIAAALKPT